MKILFATANAGKLREASKILGEGFEVVSPKDLGIDGEVEETGSTLKENSQLKARHLYKLTGMNCFADDTGLEVDALGGAPGVYTARYASEKCSSEENITKLLSELEGVTDNRSAKFLTVITLILDGKEYFFEGKLEGSIATQRSGTEGFGYDPVFIPTSSELQNAGITEPQEPPQKQLRTLSELSLEGKNAISHRGKALRAMTAFLAKYKPCPHDEDAHPDNLSH